ncbi:MAG: hypothetical protein AUK06_00375 [Parcubacteria group bacterium CG2_30_36_18]|uniref:Uncharacterized protein n=4 Tax=Candidatus Nealsoniibacteriota TaxID=1817911 RepID=A0A2M8DLN8_9BACT|nr:MAG: hypothetical protein AUK06_00375 [Parcubacteria group bacterium CG2_30_36_18]PIP24633.1 MAG: hypothetical protein COX33_00880 [Candidatus Nealsonbacteria bacterium CG23_combo_of_CG06-09_8_20_14_all_36_125]PIR72055.1 MAG: hypothetical protein COU41_00985 [Candidatus Nealsonbacteria bacterium CG10_big_fil_rev_8_21_14_0_10_36_228]PIX88287.1 MAG: hypothetical protein COZ30_01235 [Candidatus Nealsonbacteria bacterium CG_4_10_14_3_um_filter_36_16]PJB98707.1 MAG: hypothetical protein CO078_011
MSTLLPAQLYFSQFLKIKQPRYFKKFTCRFITFYVNKAMANINAINREWVVFKDIQVLLLLKKQQVPLEWDLLST